MTRCCAPPGLSGLCSAVGPNSYGDRIAKSSFLSDVVPGGLAWAAERKRGRSRTCVCTRPNAPSRSPSHAVLRRKGFRKLMSRGSQFVGLSCYFLKSVAVGAPYVGRIAELFFP